MNTPSPLVPQGTQPQRGKSSLYFKVLMILTVHVVLIGGMLLQGCKDTAKETAKDPALSQTGTGTDATAPTNTLAATDPSVPPVSTSAISNQAMSTMPVTQPMVQTTPVPAPAVATAPMTSAPAPTPAVAGDGKDYLIAKGDTLAAIAKRNSVSLKALKEANPGLNERKLKIGQKLQIPASSGAVATVASASKETPAVDGAPEGGAYVVKTGDTLGKIARLHGTSYKRIMALNDLKTTAIHVGQKLKMPAPKPLITETPVASSIAAAPGPVSSVSSPATGVAN